MQNPRLLVFGEALTDMIRLDDSHWLTRAGGSCWNVARVAARLGIATGFAGSISNECFGEEIAQQSAAAGLDLRFFQRSDKNPFMAVVHQTQPPAYYFLGNDTADLAFQIELLPPHWRESLLVVHFGSLGLVREPLASQLVALVIELKQAGVQISYDPNWRNLMGPDYRQRFETFLSIADWIKISDEDLAHLMPELPLDLALEQVIAWAGDAQILYTQGAQGLRLYHHGQVDFIAALPVTVVDTVGAGDASMGGWLSSLLAFPARSPQEHAQFAAATAATVCQYPGAYAPQLAEVNSTLARY
ncbi:carbohydrate kinase [Deefgea sp. CFH1-16]|uniref:carbohydrate kinase family protein n=1 Tax=Deefgea sp. CFH1-16 TaxID=2675457 RepID=UPI0015F6B22D|nr:carbohydrate kinase [Deefgea sp. CFH1-16]MBM5575071.1 carbohydrate kinase [Deefgea sp. CFH1-16]